MEFYNFLEDLNKRQDRIKFTAEISTQSCNFLDLTIYKSPTFLSTNLLSTKIFYKHTNTFPFPLGSSDMPYHIYKSIAIGELTQLLRNTENPSLFRYYKNKLIKHFTRREYPIKILKLLCNMTHNMRLQILHRLKPKKLIERPLPFITTYTKYDPPLNKIFKKRWQNIYEEQSFYSLLPNTPFMVFRNKKTLKSLLTAKRRRFETPRYHPNLQLNQGGEFKTLRFNHHHTK